MKPLHILLSRAAACLVLLTALDAHAGPVGSGKAPVTSGKAPIGSGQDTGLIAAVRDGDRDEVAALLAGGASPSVADRDGNTALMHAAARGDFETSRLLLWAGARASVKSSAGQTALDLAKETRRPPLDLVLLLRCYAFLEAKAKIGGPARIPHLVLIQDNTLDYAHPEIMPHYLVNKAESGGKAGADDDRDGFIDDVYGWNIANNKPHQFRKPPADNPAENRELIEWLFKTFDRASTGDEKAKQDIEELKTTFSNPLAEQFGASGQTSDASYLQLLIGLSHGTHVAGLVINSSGKEAQVQALAWQPFQRLSRLPELTFRTLEQRAKDARSFDEFFTGFREEVLAGSLQSGALASQYIRSSGAGVVNMSFVVSVDAAFKRVRAMLEVFFSRNRTRGRVNIEQDQVRNLALEVYTALCIENVVPIYENPDVLFVAAAGNDSADNDLTLQVPAYLSRFFPNVITVAAVDGDGELAQFSNYGKRSVNVAAPGVAIESCAVEGLHVRMDGTSMAAPQVAGLAAHLRHLNPKVPAREVRTIIESSVDGSRTLARAISSGGVVSPRKAEAAMRARK